MIHKYIKVLLCTFAIMLTAMTCEDEYFSGNKCVIINKSEQDTYVTVKFLNANNTYDGLWVETKHHTHSNTWIVGSNTALAIFGFLEEGNYKDLSMAFYAFADITFNTLGDIDFEDYPYIDKIKLSYEELEARNFELVYSEDGFEK